MHQPTLLTFLEPEATRSTYSPASSAVILTSLKTAVPFCSFILLPPEACMLAACPLSSAASALGFIATCQTQDVPNRQRDGLTDRHTDSITCCKTDALSNVPALLAVLYKVQSAINVTGPSTLLLIMHRHMHARTAQTWQGLKRAGCAV